ncbi:MAG: hypothetical protein ACHQ53_13310, partial [Polyangiales bacterium]
YFPTELSQWSARVFLAAARAEVTTGILIIHTAGQLEEASSLVDLLEASLALPPGAIRCSSLPGYAWAARAGGTNGNSSQFGALLDQVGAAIAFLDQASLAERQVWFDLAAAWARGKRIALIADSDQRRAELPAQLHDATVIPRIDRDAIASLVEDLAFDLGVNPRLGKDAQRALNSLSSAPPPPPARQPDGNNGARFAPPPPAVAIRAATPVVDSTPPPPRAPQSDVADLDELLAEADDIAEVGADEVEPLRDTDDDLAPEPQAGPARGSPCTLSLEAGRAISECSFHRGEGGDPAVELEETFGRFIDLVGGNWGELKRLGDVDVWLGATDNLLESLPSSKQQLSEWYEMGFQFTTLQSIAEQGTPADPSDRAVFDEMWGQSMSAFRDAARNAQVAAHEVRHVQSLLENLIGPEPQRDYANVGRSLKELRGLAESADRHV